MPASNFRRTLFGVAAATAAASLVLTGCSSASDSTTGSAGGDGEPITLVIANSQWLDALRGENLWNAVKEYEAVNPDVTLVQEAIPSSDFASKLTTEFGARQGPDIAMMQEGLFHTIVDAGSLAPIDEAFEGIENLNSTNDAGVIDGERYGIGWHRAVYALVYNQPLTESAGAEVPTTVDELIESAQAVAATGKTGFIARESMADFSSWFMDFQNWVYGYGGGWSDEDGTLTIDTPENVEAIEAFKEMYDAGLIPPGEDMPTMRTRFKEAGVGYTIDNSGGTLNMATGGTLPSTDVAAAALPFENPGAYQQIFAGVSANSEHQEAAKDFLTWLVGDDGQTALRGASGPDTLATDVPLDADFVAANPWAPTFAELAINANSTLITGHESDTSEIMRIVMESVERVLTTDADPADELAAAQNAIDQKFSS
jgi:multiple sugar transport system substrate-binding protein